MAFLLLLFFLPSCKKSFTEVRPKGSVIAETTQDYYLLLNNPVLTIGGGSAQVILGDEVATMEPYYNAMSLTTKNLFEWQDDVYLPGQTAGEMTTLMPQVYTYNTIINEVMASKDGTEQQKLSIRAEAKAGRAWANFLLINYFAKPYNPATAATDPGYPIITEADVTQTVFSRGTVKEMYDFIVKDLTEAIPDLPATITARIRMSRPAAEALLGKVYVFMQRFSDAVPLLNAAIAGLGTASVPTRLYDYNTAFVSGGAFFPIGTFGPTVPTGALYEENMYARTFSNVSKFILNDVFLSPAAFALFNTADLRLKMYISSPYNGTAFTAPGFRKKLAGSMSENGVLVPDLYLLSAESKARTGDTTGAKADLLTLRTKRMPATAAALPAGGLNQQQWIQYVLEERVREFALEGFRWFDMRRLSVDPLFSNTSYTHTVYATNGTVVKTFTLRPERLVMRFPPIIMDQNPALENNP